MRQRPQDGMMIFILRGDIEYYIPPNCTPPGHTYICTPTPAMASPPQGGYGWEGGFVCARYPLSIMVTVPSWGCCPKREQHKKWAYNSMMSEQYVTSHSLKLPLYCG